MKIPKVSFPIPFKRKKTETQTQFLPKPKGVILIGNFTLYQSDKTKLETFPLFVFEISEETFLLLKGYTLYSTLSIPKTFVDGINFIKPEFVEINLSDNIPPDTKISDNSLPKIGELERKVAKVVVKKIVQELSRLPLTCEKELAGLTNHLGSLWLKLKLFKEFGGENLILKAKAKAIEKGKDIDERGVYSAVIDELSKVDLFSQPS